ncbi:hypothetical protein [Massilia sp. PWRC2]|uniref:hypothetical protein n=1 Tax=Massilia sp. PWRC2 TaxID=2804626 RepID=UPI003CE9DC5C
MDWISTVIGFVVGTATGAAGTYYADKYTDERRARDQTKAEDLVWSEAFNKFPGLMNEMRADVQNPAFPNVREFFVKHSGTTVNNDAARFQYFTDVHGDIGQAVAYFEEVGYIEDITPGNCPMYRMRLDFVERLKAMP